MKALAIFSFLVLCVACKDSVGVSSTSNFDSIPAAIASKPINELPSISNVSVQKEGETYTINYDLTDDDSKLDVKIFGVKISDKTTFDETQNASGDIGMVAPGENKRIVWSPGNHGFDRLQIIADDQYELNIPEILNHVSSERIANDLQKIEGVRHFENGRDLLKKTQDYLIQQFEQNNLSITSHIFPWNGIEGKNVIGTLDGINTFAGRYAICGHFDTVGATPGSDDNASGTIGMLEAMRVLSLFRFSHSIDFIGFDLEERGLRGSRAYVQEIATRQSINGLINFEMIGYTCRSVECENLSLADTSIYNIAIPASSALQDAFQDAGSYVPQLKIRHVIADGDPNFRRSDHAPFWDAGISALFITDGANFRNPHYHQTTDKFTTIDIDFMTQIVKTAIATILDVAEPMHVDAYTIDIN